MAQLKALALLLALRCVWNVRTKGATLGLRGLMGPVVRALNGHQLHLVAAGILYAQILHVFCALLFHGIPALICSALPYGVQSPWATPPFSPYRATFRKLRDFVVIPGRLQFQE